MIGESDLDGVFFPVLLLLATVALVLTLLLRWVLRRLRIYRFVWHAGLFDTALFVLVLWLIALGTTGLGLPGSNAT